MHKTVVIAGYARSPFHPASRGALARLRPDDLLAQTIKGLLARCPVALDEIEDHVAGCAFPEGEQGLNVARLAGFLAGLPQSVAAATVNRFCGSSMQGIHMAAGAVQMDAGRLFLCTGVESMSRVPMAGFNPSPNPLLAQSYPQAYMGMGETAENVAKAYGVDRARMERMALESQQKAARAAKDGSFADEIVSVRTRDGEVTMDGILRPDTTLEGLAGLKPAFVEGGTVTAGTSSPLTDGAAAVLVAEEGYARSAGLTPLARIRSVAVAGCAPETMGMGPVAASKKALVRAGIGARDLDVIELNEAFAAQALACIDALELDEAKVNLDGGAIALGHPLGATGARITGKAASLLERTGGRYALATQCIGGGQGIATVLEAV
ncbi:MAG: thiolase family protein [Geminicoccaceae bacterium]|nr:thiolase family protein [Geminicoccaceae bacterium]